jgi:hypothetical protein
MPLGGQKKEEKDAAKKHQVWKALEKEALKKRCHQQSLDELSLEESLSETVSGEDEYSGDDDAGLRYDTMTYLAHLPDVRPLVEPIGGSTIEGEGEPGERETGVGPSARGATSSGAPQEGSVAPIPRA